MRGKGASESGRVLVSALCAITILLSSALLSSGSLVTGNVVGIGLKPLETKMLFYPTNAVLVTDLGLSAGPAEVITCTNGVIWVLLDAGSYNVSFPLIPWRKSFCITVPAGITNNITNLLCNVTGLSATGIATEDGDGLLPDGAAGGDGILPD